MVRERSYSVNGTNVYALVNPNLRSFCLSLYIRAGSLFEDSSDNGISHLFEHIVFSNLKRKYDKFYELLALHSVDFQGSTYKEFIRFTINGPYYEFDFATEILCSLFDDIKLTSYEFNNEKKRIKAEIREKDERSSLEYFFNKIVWTGNEAEKTVLGYCKVLDSISIKKINDFRKKIFSKDNFFIYVTGNVSDEKIESLVAEIEMLDINQTNCGFTNEVTVNGDFFQRDGIIRVRNNYWHYIKIGFDVNSQKYSGGVHDLLYAVLFKGDKSLLHNYLSEDNPLMYSFDSTYEQYDNIGNIHFMFEIESEKIEEAIKTIVKILNDVKNGNFNFEANLKYEMSISELEWDRPDDLNWSMAYFNHILKTDPIDYTDEYYGRFRNITKENVMQAAKEIFKRSNMTVAIKGDKKKIKIKQIEEILDLLD